MLLRDPVHGLIDLRERAAPLLERLVATAEVQRLRRIKQLGLASLVYPGAEHSRFCHAIGTAAVMMRFIRRFEACMDALPPEDRGESSDWDDLLAAALLHDLGHGPLSHLFEDLIPGGVSHEVRTLAIVRDPSSEVHRVLHAWREGMPEGVCALLEHRHRLAFMSQSISGSLDADRCDYLLRDSHMTGVRYGLFDLDWLIHGICIAKTEEDEVVLAVDAEKGLPPLEAYLLGRDFMYRQVYRHKGVHAAEALVHGMVQRALACLREEDGRASVWCMTPRALLDGARGTPIQTEDFLDLDDHTMEAAFASWCRHPDKALQDLAYRYRHRLLPRSRVVGEGEDAQALVAIVSEIAARHGLPPSLYVRLDDDARSEPPLPCADGRDATDAPMARETCPARETSPGASASTPHGRRGASSMPKPQQHAGETRRDPLHIRDARGGLLPHEHMVRVPGSVQGLGPTRARLFFPRELQDEVHRAVGVPE